MFSHLALVMVSVSLTESNSLEDGPLGMPVGDQLGCVDSGAPILLASGTTPWAGSWAVKMNILRELSTRGCLPLCFLIMNECGVTAALSS